MKPAPFEYVPVETVEAAVRALAAGGPDAKLLAGGQSLVPMLNFRLVRPSLLVDINRVAGLSFVVEQGDAVRIGALTRHRALETSPLIARHFPVVAEAVRHVGHVAIRNRGTIGGSLAHADPAAELPMLAMLLDAELKIVSARGARVAPAREFFAGALATTLAADELVSEITLAKPPLGSGWGFSEVARRGGDFALAAVAALLTRRGERIAQARIAMMGVGETPLRATAAEALLVGNSVSPDLLEAVGAAVRAACSPAADLHASAEYRRHVVGLLAQQVVGLAWQRATGAAA